MLKVVETFSGIGSQAKALKRSNLDHKILRTADWDINAIIAYDIINSENYSVHQISDFDKNDVINKLNDFSLSANGKIPLCRRNLEKMDIEIIKRLDQSIKRTNNMLSIINIKGKDIPNECNLLSYSFPCQDLSNAGFWHGNLGGIDRSADNRSSMLWQIERILTEKKIVNDPLPRFLLMENVSSILSNLHTRNFEEWKDSLVQLGYRNIVLKLNANKFGIPQKRSRVFMISYYEENCKRKEEIKEYFTSHNLTDNEYVRKLNVKYRQLKDCLFLDYSNERYYQEACRSQPNDTPSRKEIYKKNLNITNNLDINFSGIPTITTKQDRHPNSGVIDFSVGEKTKSPFRYLTPRECFLLMGFDELDFDKLIKHNFQTNRGLFFTWEKLYRMAGNSIVVDILEQIFILINSVNNIYYS